MPTVLSVGTLPLWAGWVDRMHAAEFRSKLFGAEFRDTKLSGSKFRRTQLGGALFRRK